jgi:hypothetical protein
MHAFSLIELMISLSLSSFIMLGMMQAYQNAAKSLENVRGHMATTRKACLLFNQVERDFSTMFIPFLSETIIPDKEKKEAQEAKKEEKEAEKKPEADKGSEKEKETEKEKRSDKLKIFLQTTIYEDATIRIDGKRYELFKSINFITSNPLQVYGEKKVRMARVMYELVPDKAKSKGDKTSYNLYRKETIDLENVSMKENEDDVAQNKQPRITTHLVTDNIKTMFIEMVTEKKEDPENKEKQEPTEVRFFTWGDKPETKGVVPKTIELTVVLWNDTLQRERTFHIMTPVFSYPTPFEPEKEDQATSAKDSEGKDKNQQATAIPETSSPTATPQQPATPPNTGGLS